MSNKYRDVAEEVQAMCDSMDYTYDEATNKIAQAIQSEVDKAVREERQRICEWYDDFYGVNQRYPQCVEVYDSLECEMRERGNK